MKRRYRTPIKADNDVKALPVIKSSFHTDESPIDHTTNGTSIVWRAMLGNTIGMVFLPIARSPSISLKSCEWMVVANIPALMQMDNKAIWSNFEQSEPMRPLPLISQGASRVDTDDNIPATKVAPASNDAKPAALTPLRTIQCPECADSSLYMTVNMTNDTLAKTACTL